MVTTGNDTLIKTLFSGLLGAALGISVTYSTGVASNRTEIVRLATKVEALTSIIQDNMSDRYRGVDATRDFNAIRDKLELINERDAALEILLRQHIKEHNR